MSSQQLLQILSTAEKRWIGRIGQLIAIKTRSEQYMLCSEDQEENEKNSICKSQTTLEAQVKILQSKIYRKALFN